MTSTFPESSVPSEGPPPGGYSAPGGIPQDTRAYGDPKGYGNPTSTAAGDNLWAAGAHLSGFLAAYVALGFIGPLVVLLVQGEKSPYVRKHAVEALNFNLSWMIYVAVSYVLTFVLIGFVTLAILAVAYLILVIMASVAANEGRFYRYPATIRFVS